MTAEVFSKHLKWCLIIVLTTWDHKRARVGFSDHNTDILSPYPCTNTADINFRESINSVPILDASVQTVDNRLQYDSIQLSHNQ